MADKDERRTALLKLLAFDGDLDSIMQDLDRFGWDCDESLLVLNAEHVRKIIDRFTSGTLSAGQVEDWANLIECREDISMDAAQEEALEEAIFLLANPEINFPISNQLALRIVKGLEG